MQLFSGGTPNPRLLRAIAVFEGVKGALVLAAGTGLFSLGPATLAQLVDGLVAHFHWNPASGVPRIFLRVMSEATETHLRWLALGALVYASFRLAEAYGLWRQRRWASFMGAIGAGLYIPVEVYEIAVGVSAVKILTLTGNILILLVLTRTALAQHRIAAPPQTL